VFTFSVKQTWLVISCCCLAEDGVEMYQNVERTCKDIVLVVNTAVQDAFDFNKISITFLFLMVFFTGQRPYREVSGVVELYDMLLDGFILERPAHCSKEL